MKPYKGTEYKLKGKLIRATDADRCCKEAVRIALQSQRAWFFSGLAQVWDPPSESAVYVGFVSTPKPGAVVTFEQGWRSAAPKAGTGVIAVGAIILSLLQNEERRSGVQTVVELASNLFDAARDAALKRGQDHCGSCILGNCLRQDRGRAYRTERIRRRI